MIWTDDYLNQLFTEAAEAVNIEVPCIYHREYIAVYSGSTYLTPSTYIKSILRITYRGIKLEPLTRLQMLAMFPKRFTDSTAYQGTPYYYYLEPGVYNQEGSTRLYLTPVPMEDLSDSGGDPFSPQADEPYCTLSMYRYVDDSNSLYTIPDYISIPIRRAYALWQAFKKEGPGQDLKAANFWSQKYNFYLNFFKDLNNRVFIAKIRTLTGNQRNDRRPAKPVLPSNFERVVYK